VPVLTTSLPASSRSPRRSVLVTLSGGSLLATHGSAGSPVSCATGAYASDAIALPEVDTTAKANDLTVKLFVRNSGGGQSQHRLATLGVTYSLDGP
jgi:hypothetical protein